MTTKITSQEINRYLFRKFPEAQIYLADENYFTINKDTIDTQTRILNNFKLMKFCEERRDCDDYTIMTYGLMKGLLGNTTFMKIWANIYDENGILRYKHALAGFIDDKRDFYYFEPQTNKIFSFSSRIKPYFIEC
jgi:hypothetical protein